jgi:lipoprotein-anchoring transpeptidase ErfK/SrfK
VFASALVACTRTSASLADAAARGAAEAGADASALVDLPDGRAEAAALARSRFEAGTYEGPFIGATNMVVSVLTDPVWPESDAGSQRIGYLRHGARVPVLEGVLPNDECTDGWYELVQGGYVCGKAATLDLKSARVKLAPRGPDLDAGLPYRYGYNVTNGTPVYRRVLSIEDRKKYEPWLAPKPTEPAGGGDEEGTASASASDEEPPVENQSANSKREATSPASPERGRSQTGSAAAASASASPWYLRTDGGKPDIRLGELRGRGVLVRRMVRGFFLALDRDFKAAGAHWWRSTYGFAIPFERVVLEPKLSDYHGFWAAIPEAAPPPTGRSYAFVTGGAAVKLLYDRDKNKFGWSDALPKRRAVALTGEKVTVGGVVALETTEGFFVREADVKPAAPGAVPSDLAPGEKWIDVDLTRQMLVAYEGTTPVFGTLVSTGKRNLVDKDKDHPTPTGVFRIREKHVTATMDGDVAADGPYSLEDVPWVMYFQGSFALHGAFWHNGFGGTRSHGCVNLAPDDARALFNWTDPPLPKEWHGVFSTDQKPGTRIFIHEDEPPKKR